MTLNVIALLFVLTLGVASPVRLSYDELFNLQPTYVHVILCDVVMIIVTVIVWCDKVITNSNNEKILFQLHAMYSYYFYFTFKKFNRPQFFKI